MYVTGQKRRAVTHMPWGLGAELYSSSRAASVLHLQPLPQTLVFINLKINENSTGGWGGGVTLLDRALVLL